MKYWSPMRFGRGADDDVLAARSASRRTRPLRIVGGRNRRDAGGIDRIIDHERPIGRAVAIRPASPRRTERAVSSTVRRIGHAPDRVLIIVADADRCRARACLRERGSGTGVCWIAVVRARRGTSARAATLARALRALRRTARRRPRSVGLEQRHVEEDALGARPRSACRSARRGGGAATASGRLRAATASSIVTRTMSPLALCG